MDKKKVIFICTQNSARSQMAEGLLRHLYGDYYEVYSAGTRPFRVNPYAIKAMNMAGIDISGHRSKSVDEYRDQEFDCVVTVCDSAKEDCPYFPHGKRLIHRSFEDPASGKGSDEEITRFFERVRDEINDWLKETFSPAFIKNEELEYRAHLDKPGR